MIQFEHIHFRREQQHILDDISLRMNSDEHWVVLGKNGSGKSTLLEIMNGYAFPSSGKTEVLGNLYGRCDVREVRKSIGYISQSLMEKLTLRDPVWEVVATGEYGFLRFYEEIPAELKQKAVERLDQIGLAHLQNNTLGTLSQGERKKIMLARAMMTDPRILIMDEPCSGLDLYEREKLLQTITKLGQGDLQIIYVTHHIEEIVPMFTHVALLNEGKLIAAGTKQEVLTTENLIRVYGVPITMEWIDGRAWIRVLSEAD